MTLFELMAKISLDSSQFDKGIADASNKGSKFADGLKNSLKTIGKVATASFGAASAAVVAFGKIGVSYNTQMETYTTNFETMLGSQEAAIKKVEELKKFAASTPLSMSDLAQGTQTLLAFGVASENTTGILRQLGDISLGNAEKMQSLAIAYGKAKAQGKLMGENVQMMIDAGFNPLIQISKTTGESMEQVQKRMADGKISVEELESALEAVTSAGGQFAGGMEKASKTTAGLISTLKDNAQALIGEVFEPISQSLLQEVLPSALNGISQLTESFRSRGIDGMIETAGKLVGAFVAKITEKLPTVFKLATKMVQGFLKAIIANIPQIAKSAVEMISQFIEMLADMLPTIITAVIDLATNVVKALVQNIPNILAALAKGILGSIGAIIKGLFGIESASEKAAKKLSKTISEMQTLKSAMSELTPQMQAYEGIISASGETLGSLDQKISDAEAAITKTISDALAAQQGLRKKDIDDVNRYIQALRDAEDEKLAIYQSQQSTELLKLQLDAEAGDTDAVIQRLVNMQSALEESNRQAEEIYTSRLTTIEQYYSARGMVGTDEYASALAEAKAFYDEALRQNESYYAQGTALAAEMIGAPIDLTKWTDAIDEAQNLAKNSFIYGDDVVNSYAAVMDELLKSNAADYLKLISDTVAAGGELTDEQKKNVTDILKLFNGMPGYVEELGRDTLLALISGMDSTLGDVEQYADESTHSIIKTVAEAVGSDDIFEWVDPWKILGLRMTQGMTEGIKSGKGNIIAAARDTIIAAVKAAKDAAGIHSPSKVFMEIGGFMMKGLAIGIDKGSQFVLKSLSSLYDSIAADSLSVEGQTFGASVFQAITGGTGIVGSSVIDGLYSIFSFLGDEVAGLTRYGEYDGATESLSRPVIRIASDLNTILELSYHKYRSEQLQMLDDRVAGQTKGIASSQTASSVARALMDVAVYAPANITTPRNTAMHENPILGRI